MTNICLREGCQDPEHFAGYCEEHLRLLVNKAEEPATKLTYKDAVDPAPSSRPATGSGTPGTTVARVTPLPAAESVLPTLPESQGAPTATFSFLDRALTFSLSHLLARLSIGAFLFP
jgi:hypothetical protein